jgi:hypothetical protein
MRGYVRAFCLVVFMANAALGAEPEKVTPELAPSPAVLKIIEGLGDNCSAALPKPTITGDINAVAKRWGLDKRGPGYRDYCLKMAWMPERKRAIFYGANHGGPHRLNDVWEYDLPSNTWVCLYGPDPSKGRKADWKDVDWDNVKEGVIRTKRGGPVIVGHSWWNMTYDPKLKAMITPCSWSMTHPELRTLLKKGKHKPPMWAFYPEKKKWEPILDSTFDGPVPSYENARALEYVPELGGTVWTKSAGMWLYDSKANAWKRLGTSKRYGKHLPGREQVMAYLPHRKMLVAHARAGKGKPSIGYDESRTFHYDIAKNTWTQTFQSKKKNEPPAGMDSVTNFVYDRVGKVCLLWDANWTKALWAYDPATMKWAKLSPKKGPPPPLKPRDVKLAYYDPELNVFVIPGKWVYRHKRAGAK